MTGKHRKDDTAKGRFTGKLPERTDQTRQMPAVEKVKAKHLDDLKPGKRGDAKAPAPKPLRNKHTKPE